MISIIICSKLGSPDEKLINNIQYTIGVEYELIVIDNSKNEHTIFSAYNIGIRKAKYPILCFMHEDVIFHSLNWGNEVINSFNDPSVGLLGVIGSCYLSKQSMGWWSVKNATTGSIIQGDVDLKGK